MRLQELKRGMKCTYRNGIEFIVSTQVTPSEYSGGEIEYLDRKPGGGNGIYNMNDDLTHGYNENLDIMKVEDITLDGYEVIWEREEDKYYLKIPNAKNNGRQYLNFDSHYHNYFFDGKESSEVIQTQFTIVEIENLPKQKFIQTLEKELVE